ncbi:MAG: hypothetical protein OQL19_16385 [Gammaproteobacteria bacterium]|nr:hypothetical protein [Gammaproteobacteria bacterium]
MSHVMQEVIKQPYFNFATYLDQHPKTDITYRFLLWGSLSIILFYLASISDPSGGGSYLKSAVESGNKGIYWNVLCMIGLIVLLTSLLFQHIFLLLNDGSIKASVAFFSSTTNKIASDLLSAGFGLSAGMLGWLIFIYISNINIEQDFWVFTLIAAWGFIGMGVLTLFLGCSLWLLKVINHHLKLHNTLKKANLFVVILVYPSLIYFCYLVLWYFTP